MEKEKAPGDEETYRDNDHVRIKRGEYVISCPWLQGGGDGDEEDRRKPVKGQCCDRCLLKVVCGGLVGSPMLPSRPHTSHEGGAACGKKQGLGDDALFGDFLFHYSTRLVGSSGNGLTEAVVPRLAVNVITTRLSKMQKAIRAAIAFRAALAPNMSRKNSVAMSRSDPRASSRGTAQN